MTFESFTSIKDTSPALTPNENVDDNTLFKIEKIEAKQQDEGSLVITILYLKDKILQIIRPGTGESYRVMGSKCSSRKDAWKFKQELATNPEMKLVMRENDIMDLFQHITVNHFYDSK